MLCTTWPGRGEANAGPCLGGIEDPVLAHRQDLGTCLGTSDWRRVYWTGPAVAGGEQKTAQ